MFQHWAQCDCSRRGGLAKYQWRGLSWDGLSAVVLSARDLGTDGPGLAKTESVKYIVEKIPLPKFWNLKSPTRKFLAAHFLHAVGVRHPSHPLWHNATVAAR